MVFGAAPFSGTQARDASGMWVTPGHWLLTPERSLVLVWCLHSANFAFVSPVKVSPHYKSHLRSHTSSAESFCMCQNLRVPVGSSCFLCHLLSQDYEAESKLIFVQKKMWQIWSCFTRFNIQHRSSSICPALGLVKVKVKLVRKRLHFVFEMSTWSYDFHINPLLKCSQRAGCVEMQILCEPVTGQTVISHCTEHTLSFSKGRTRNGLIHRWADIWLCVKQSNIVFVIFTTIFVLQEDWLNNSWSHFQEALRFSAFMLQISIRMDSHTFNSLPVLFWKSVDFPP